MASTTTTTPFTHHHIPHLHHLSSATSLLAPISPSLAASTTSRLISLLDSRSFAGGGEVTLTPSNLRQFCKKCLAPLIPGWSCEVRTRGGQGRYGEIGKAIRKEKRAEARKRARREQARAEKEGAEGVKKEGEAERLRRKQAEKEKGIVLECGSCGHTEQIMLEKPKAVKRKRGVKAVTTVVKEVATTTTTTTVTATQQSTTQTQVVQTTIAQNQGTAKGRAKKRKQGLLSEVLANKKREDEAKARGGGFGGGLGGLDLMDLMKTG